MSGDRRSISRSDDQAGQRTRRTLGRDPSAQTASPADAGSEKGSSSPWSAPDRQLPLLPLPRQLGGLGLTAPGGRASAVPEEPTIIISSNPQFERRQWK